MSNNENEDWRKQNASELQKTFHYLNERAAAVSRITHKTEEYMQKLDFFVKSACSELKEGIWYFDGTDPTDYHRFDAFVYLGINHEGLWFCSDPDFARDAFIPFRNLQSNAQKEIIRKLPRILTVFADALENQEKDYAKAIEHLEILMEHIDAAIEEGEDKK